MTDEPTLRQATRADTAEIDAMIARSYQRLLAPDYPPSVLVGAVASFTTPDPQLIRSGHYFVVRENGRIVAAGGWSSSAPGAARTGPGTSHVRRVGTDPRHARRGHGTRLMTHILADAAAEGMHEIQCLSTLTAVPFYRACGFAVVGPGTLWLGPARLDFAVVRMRRPFDP